MTGIPPEEYASAYEFLLYASAYADRSVRTRCLQDQMSRHTGYKKRFQTLP